MELAESEVFILLETEMREGKILFLKNWFSSTRFIP